MLTLTEYVVWLHRTIAYCALLHQQAALKEQELHLAHLLLHCQPSQSLKACLIGAVATTRDHACSARNQSDPPCSPLAVGRI